MINLYPSWMMNLHREKKSCSSIGSCRRILYCKILHCMLIGISMPLLTHVLGKFLHIRIYAGVKYLTNITCGPPYMWAGSCMPTSSFSSLAFVQVEISGTTISNCQLHDHIFDNKCFRTVAVHSCLVEKYKMRAYQLMGKRF